MEKQKMECPCSVLISLNQLGVVGSVPYLTLILWQLSRKVSSTAKTDTAKQTLKNIVCLFTDRLLIWKAII